MITTFQGVNYDTFQDYENSDHWRTLRRNFLASRKTIECFICQSTTDICVTHKYLKNYYTVDGVRKFCTILGRECYKDLRMLCQSCRTLVTTHNLHSVLNKNKILNPMQLHQWADERLAGNTGATLRKKMKKYEIIQLHSQQDGKRYLYENEIRKKRPLVAAQPDVKHDCR